ncbi:hypothetical protein PJ15_2857 [Acinetobacter sp. neg1]|nr:hypothetical protein PJ15_2857 [Acinetobacter sp. neg1]
MHAILLDQPKIVNEESNLKIEQKFNSIERPSEAKVLVEQSQLDDSVIGVRTEYKLKRKHNVWVITNKQQSYKCSRGKNTEKFQFDLCP